MLKLLIGILVLLVINPLFAAPVTVDLPPFSANDLSMIQTHLFANIATENNHLNKKMGDASIYSQPGAIIASPSKPGEKFSQDYSFHWVRDAAITLSEVASLYELASPEEKVKLKPYLINYINFETRAQSAQSNHGEKTLGQPKYNIDGNIWEGRWARPQNDSPALRAITLIKLYNLFNTDNDKSNDKSLQTKLLSMIRLDLDYIAREWNAPSYDLWEEILDKEHFFTQIVQRKALLLGAKLFKSLDRERANTYSSVAENLGSSLDNHWRDANGYFSETIAQQDHKGGGVNSAVLLGILYGQLDNPKDLFALNDDRVLSSVYFLRASFGDLYQINVRTPSHVPLIGRYPNDIYDGNLFLYGNPWVLSSNALAEYYYALANVYVEKRKIRITRSNRFFFKQLNPEFDFTERTITGDETVFYEIIASLIANGDDLLKTVKKYSTCYDGSCLHFSEQIDRASGRMISAKDLSWSYSTLLSAMRARNNLIGKVKDL